MTDRIDALERLQKLRESGAITEAEFDREKAALLEQPESSPATIEPPSAHGPRSTGRVPIWALLAAGAVLLALIVGAMLLLRSSDGGRASGDDVTARAEANESAPVNAVEAAPAPTIRSRPETEQLAAAFRAAFGNRPTRQVGQADITYRPGTLLWIGERAVLISDGTNPHECHACAGMVAVHALLPAADGFRVTGEWLSVATGGYGHPPEWRVTNELTGRPALRVENGGGNQGVFCNFVSYYDLTAPAPTDIARVQTGYTDVGYRGEEQGTALEGRIANMRPGRSFDVLYSGTHSLTETYRLRGGRFEIVGGASRVTSC